MPGVFRDPEDINRVVSGVKKAEKIERSEDFQGGGPPVRNDRSIQVEITDDKITRNAPPCGGCLSEKNLWPAKIVIPDDGASTLPSWVDINDDQGLCRVLELNDGDLTVGKKYDGVLIGSRNGFPLISVQSDAISEDCEGLGWLEDLRSTDCLKVSLISAVGACACASAADEAHLVSTDGLIWGSPGGGGSIPRDPGAHCCDGRNSNTLTTGTYEIVFQPGGCSFANGTLSSTTPGIWVSANDVWFVGCNFSGTTDWLAGLRHDGYTYSQVSLNCCVSGFTELIADITLTSGSCLGVVRIKFLLPCS